MDGRTVSRWWSSLSGPWIRDLCDMLKWTNLGGLGKVSVLIPKIVMHSSICKPSKLWCKWCHETEIVVGHQFPTFVTNRVCFSNWEKCPTMVTTNRFAIDSEMIPVKVLKLDSIFLMRLNQLIVTAVYVKKSEKFFLKKYGWQDLIAVITNLIILWHVTCIMCINSSSCELN